MSITLVCKKMSNVSLQNLIIESIRFTDVGCYLAEKGFYPNDRRCTDIKCDCVRHSNGFGIRDIPIYDLLGRPQGNDPKNKFYTELYRAILRFNLLVSQKFCQIDLMKMYHQKISQIIQHFVILKTDMPIWSSPNYTEEFLKYDSYRLQVVWDFLKEIDNNFPRQL